MTKAVFDESNIRITRDSQVMGTGMRVNNVYMISLLKADHEKAVNEVQKYALMGCTSGIISLVMLKNSDKGDIFQEDC